MILVLACHFEVVDNSADLTDISEEVLEITMAPQQEERLLIEGIMAENATNPTLSLNFVMESPEHDDQVEVSIFEGFSERVLDVELLNSDQNWWGFQKNMADCLAPPCSYAAVSKMIHSSGPQNLTLRVEVVISSDENEGLSLILTDL